MGGSVGGEGVGPLKGLHRLVQLIYSPKRKKGRRGVDRGMDRNACGGEEKDSLQLQNSSSRLTGSEGDRVCIFSLNWSSLDMLLM